MPVIVMNRTNHITVASVIVALATGAIVIIAPNQFVKAQQPSQNASQFTANLTGESALPPITTNATGSAEFAVVGDGNTMTYKIDADNIDKVTDVFVAASSGGRFVDLVQLRSSVNEGVSEPISGTLVEGNFTASDFTGRLDINQMSGLVKLILDGNAYVRVQTTDVPLGEIVGKITPNLPS
jgi:hypothetical protein